MTSRPIIAVSAEAARRLEWGHLPGGWAAVALLVLLFSACTAVLLLYRSEGRSGSSVAVRMRPAALRCAALLVLLGIAIDPRLVTDVLHRRPGQVVLLVDGSQSMSLRDDYPIAEDAARVARAVGLPPASSPAGHSRRELLERAIIGAELLKRLPGGSELKVVTFDEARPATDVGRAIRDAIGGSQWPPAALVVCSDGQFNTGEPPEAVAAFARTVGVPIHTVAVGDPVTPPNVAVEAVQAPDDVFINDPFTVSGEVYSQGFDGQAVTVELVAAENGTVIGSREMTAEPGGASTRVSFQHQLATPGRARLALRARAEGHEPLLQDNTREVMVRASDQRLAVLLISGEPTWGYRYLARLLERDRAVDVACWLQSADTNAVRDGDVVLDHLPTAAELTRYDCIVLLDPSAEGLDQGWLTAAGELASRQGGGLLYGAGPQHTPALMRQPQAAALKAALPVMFDPPSAELTLNALGAHQSSAWPVQIPAQASGHPLLSLLAEQSENTRLWASMPGVYWHYPAARPKPAASVLLRHGNPAMSGPDGAHILFAVQYTGSGRTAYLGFDSTWRWRRVGEEVYSRFWIRLVRHLAEGRLAGARNGFVRARGESGTPGEPLEIEARLLTDAGQPVVASSVEVNASVEGGARLRITMQPRPGEPGWYSGRFTPSVQGWHVLRVQWPSAAGPDPSMEGVFRVESPRIEWQRTALDRTALRQLAEGSAGGQLFELDELNRLPETIPDRAVSWVSPGTPRSVLRNWWGFGLLVVLLAGEWTLRRRYYLL